MYRRLLLTAVLGLTLSACVPYYDGGSSYYRSEVYTAPAPVYYYGGGPSYQYRRGYYAPPRATIPRLVIISRHPVTTQRGQERATGPTQARVGAITAATVVMGEETAVAAIMAGAAAGTGKHLFL